MFEPAPAPEPAVAPSPPPVTGTSRFAFLVSRLRNRQITMEEATELFAIQQAMIRRAAPVAPLAPAPPPMMVVSPGGVAAKIATSSSGSILDLSDDGVWMMLLALGAGAGILSALVKRLESGPPSGNSGTPPASGSSGTR